MDTKPANQPLDLSKYRNVPAILMAVGALLAIIGFLKDQKHFAYCWLLSFMFFLSISLGALFLIIAHHLFDAGWSVPIRRFCEHIAALLFPWLAILFLPIAFLAKTIYPWMSVKHPLPESLEVKQPLFTMPMYYVTAAACFLIWWLLSNRLRYWSLKQDESGDARPTHRMRFYSGFGIVLYALSLTLAAIMWIKALEERWFSTMYGVYYFAGGVWTALATAYVITVILDRKGVITKVLHEHQYYYIGSLMFAFTVFYAYVTFAQYFIIWNGNMPDETFWYVERQKGWFFGGWFGVSMVIIFGHFLVPFLALLRIDVKLIFKFMIPLCGWAWLMHWIDLSFNIMPVVSPDGFPWGWIWLSIGCFAFMGGLLITVFLKQYAAHPPYPIKDPRLAEAMGFYSPVPTQISGGELDETDDLRDAPPQFGGTGK